MRSLRKLALVGIALLSLTACGGTDDNTGPAVPVVDYPLDGSVFPPEFVPPTFLWHDSTEDADSWVLEVAFADGQPGLVRRLDGHPPEPGVIDQAAVGRNNEVHKGTEYQQSARAWTPTTDTWEEIKRRSVEQPATFTFTGRRAADPEKVLSRCAVRISTSRDPVGAPIFYRDVPLPPVVGLKGTVQPIPKESLPLIAWRLRDVGKPESRVVLENMPTCANCHSFSNDGKTMAMDVDGPDGDKGTYLIAPVAKEMVVTDREVMTWSSFPDKPEGHRTLGFLSRISPDGKHVVTTVNEALYVQNFTDFRILQVFYPTRGILAWYSTESKQMASLPGADDTDYVHCCAVWTPDGKNLVFCRARAFDPYRPGQKPAKYAGDPNEPQIRYDLYRMPFDEGRGGTPVPIEGASDNGMSNTFPKVSPDGKWIVYTKCANGLLLRPDGRLWIVPVEGGEAREMNCNTSLMNSWHSFSPNSRWLVFSSKANTPYTQMFLTHIDEEGNDTPAILIPRSTASNRAVNLPEFLNAPSDAIENIYIPAVSHHRLYQQARKLVNGEEHAKAVAVLREALVEKPDFTQARFLLGWALVLAGGVDEGMEILEDLVRDNPEEADGHRFLGLALAKTGRMEPAIKSFERAVEIAPGTWDAWKGLGQAHFALGNLQRSRQAYERAVALRPGDTNAQESLAVLLLRLGRVKEAVTHLEVVCELAPSAVAPRLYLALYLATSPDDAVRNGTRAIEVAREAVDLTGGERPDALDILAAAYAEAGQWKDAKETVRKAIRFAEAKNRRLVPDLQARLRLYEEKTPFRQAPTGK